MPAPPQKMMEKNEYESWTGKTLKRNSDSRQGLAQKPKGS